MTLKNTAERWGWLSQALHWLIAVLILGLGIGGLIMGDLPKTPNYFWVYTAHKSIGISVLALAVLRLLWRLYAGAPKPVTGTPVWQERVANATHIMLYVLIFTIPLAGWLYDSARGLRTFYWFGLFEMPALVSPNETIRGVALEIHKLSFWALIGLVVLHAGAAFYHHLIQRDATLTRMLPRNWFSSKP
ncbi:cytochrome b [Xylella fastidiosa]|uniref:Cytochrome b n=1 Tax=Xylella fastidiosa TaxID=2371 RepID=A0ABC8AF70_XYLFS|nr:cytochrome b [Xylella fastidiosa]ALR06973.1 cytochrome b [Xylella fastidiosa]